MSSWACKLIGIWLLLAVGKGMLHAASDAEIADYSSASQAFNDRFWDRADRELTAFLENYPESEFRAEAVLFQAESRIKLGNLGSAIGLLESGRGTAGRFADEYQFWLAEARLQSGQLSAAADSYALFVSTYTNSPRLLDAIVGEAAARSQLKQWPRVAELLADPGGRFQQLANANPILAAVVRGRFLLAEAQLAQGKYEAAQQAIQPLVSQPLEPQLAWQRDFLKARILRQQGLLEEALALTNNLATFSAGFPNLKAEENAFQAGVLEQSERKEEAISAWRLNLVPAIPPERQREALLHLGDLLIGEGRLAEASQTIETFLGAGTNAATADIALLTLGELRLRLSRETNAPVSTNLLSTALESFDYVLSNYPSSTLVGRADFGRGWCLWLMNRAAESADAFQAAVNLLPPSYDQAVARFKLGDALAARKQYPQALINYKWVADNAAGLESVQTNLVEQALYQVVRVARESGDSVAANAAMASLLEKFPNGFLAERSLMSLSPQVSGASDPVAAREVFLAFITNSPDSSLIPEVKLAVARTYEQQRDWRNALSEYDAWLTDFTDNPARPRAEYFKALTTARLGDESNALTLFTNYVAKFPTNEFTPLALWWTADHYWRQDDFVNAETYYQLLFKNHPGATNLIYQAQLMAGRAATARGGRPEEAVAYFTNLTSDANCPADIQAQALFAYGDTLMSLPSGDTNKPYGNLELAIQVFSKLAQLNPNTRIALLAQGKIGHCYLQLGGVDTNAASANYNFASNAYQRILTATNHVEFADRAEAEVGLGFVMEKQARLANGTNSVNLLRGALDHYLNIVYGHSRTLDDPADMFWVNRAGVERALPLAESLQLWDQVARLCDTLANLLPPMKPMLEKRRARAEEQLRKNSN